MNWFRNLNAMPRLMVSFGMPLLLTIAISCLAIRDLRQANERIDSLYSFDMVGLQNADEIAIDVTTIRGDDLDAMYRWNDAEATARDEKDVMANLAQLRTNLDSADKHFVNKRGIEQLGIMRNALPDYERSQADLFRCIRVRDQAGAEAAIKQAVKYRAIIRGASLIAIDSKKDRAEQQWQANNEAYLTSRNLQIGALIASLLVGIVLSIVIARGLSRPLGKAVDALESIAEGNLAVSLDIDTHDEVGQMARALNTAVERLNGTMREVAESAASANSSAQQLAAASESIASGAQEQAASLEETSASLEQITATVRQSADNARQASELAAGSKDTALQGQGVVSTAVAAMAEINAASAKISDIISTIDEIAFQTNLLAVNAAVEAARAGEEGRGFAVVASEVRSLAQRSASAAKEIKVLIQDSLRKVEAGSKLVNRSGATLQEIVGSVKRVTDIVGDIATAASEQSAGIEQVNTAMTQMDHVTQSNSAQTEELSATAESLSEQASNLLALVNTFTLEDAGDRRRGVVGAQQFARPSARVSRASAMKAEPAQIGKKLRKTATSTALAVVTPAGQASDEAGFEEF